MQKVAEQHDRLLSELLDILIAASFVAVGDDGAYMATPSVSSDVTRVAIDTLAQTKVALELEIVPGNPSERQG